MLVYLIVAALLVGGSYAAYEYAKSKIAAAEAAIKAAIKAQITAALTEIETAASGAPQAKASLGKLR